MGRVFANGPRDRGSIPGRVIPKTQKMVLDAALLSTQYYEIRVKWSNPGNGVIPTLQPLGHPRLRSPTYFILLKTIHSFAHCQMIPSIAMYH